MSDLIDRQALIEKINEIYSGHMLDENISPCSIEWLITEQPTIEAVPVVHGEWCTIRIGLGDVPIDGIVFGYRYSKCHKKSDANTSYCPNCGAKMDG